MYFVSNIPIASGITTRFLLHHAISRLRHWFTHVLLYWSQLQGISPRFLTHRSPPHRFLCSSMSRFKDLSRKTSLEGHPIFIGLPSVHQHVKELFHSSLSSSHTRFSAIRRQGFLALNFLRRTELSIYHFPFLRSTKPLLAYR